MQPPERGSYFVRLKDNPSGRFQPPAATGGSGARRRTHFTVRPLPVLLAVLLGWFVWASTTDGGVSARTDDIVEGIRDVLTDATTDPALKRAASYYNDVYARQGSYPRLGAEEETAAGVGIGVDVVWCSSRAIVIRGFTGSGSRSRLLLDGRDLGDVAGDVGCPTRFDAPAPWSLPSE